MKTNDAVLIQDDKITPRNNWKKEKEELIVCRDNKIQGAVLRVYNKKKDCMFLLKRVIQRLIPFETIN